MIYPNVHKRGPAGGPHPARGRLRHHVHDRPRGAIIWAALAASHRPMPPPGPHEQAISVSYLWRVLAAASDRRRAGGILRVRPSIS